MTAKKQASTTGKAPAKKKAAPKQAAASVKPEDQVKPLIPEQKTIDAGIQEAEKTRSAEHDQTPEQKTVEAKPEQKTVEAKPAQAKTYVEAAQQDPSAVFELYGKKQYWKNAIHIPGIGHVSGAVLIEHKNKFFANSPNSNMEDWMDRVDFPYQRQIKADAKRRRKIGLPAVEIEDPEDRERLGLKPL